MTAAWPSVVGRLVDLWTPASDATVSDGPPVGSAYPERYVTVGYVDDDVAGSYSVEAIYDGSMSRETGTVRCQIVAQSGNENLSTVRAQAFAIEAQLRAAVSADHTLGVLSADGTSSMSTDILSVQNANGSAQSLVVTVSYSTRY